MKYRSVLVLFFVVSSYNLLYCKGAFPSSSANMEIQSAIDYRAEMIAFVTAIAERAKADNPQFGIFPQNASELGKSPDYVAAVTGIGQEEPYYGYNGRDGKVTPKKVTRKLERNLDRFETAGKLVLTVDYPFKKKNEPSFNRATRKRIKTVYKRSSARGYIPCVTVRNLNYLVTVPGNEPDLNEPEITSWNQVEEWVFQLQPSKNQKRTAFLESLGGSGFDLIVIDYSFDGSETGEFTPEEISSLKSSLGGKVIAYLSIGEAEDYRWYWKKIWDAGRDGKPDAGAPDWLDKQNPGWSGNYKVRFWQKEWQDIIFSYLDKIIAQGFDGVYLDIIDAYEYYLNKGSKK